MAFFVFFAALACFLFYYLFAYGRMRKSEEYLSFPHNPDLGDEQGLKSRRPKASFTYGKYLPFGSSGSSDDQSGYFSFQAAGKSWNVLMPYCTSLIERSRNGTGELRKGQRIG